MMQTAGVRHGSGHGGVATPTALPEIPPLRHRGEQRRPWGRGRSRREGCEGRTQGRKFFRTTSVTLK